MDADLASEQDEQAITKGDVRLSSSCAGPLGASSQNPHSSGSRPQGASSRDPRLSGSRPLGASSQDPRLPGSRPQGFQLASSVPKAFSVACDGALRVMLALMLVMFFAPSTAQAANSSSSSKASAASTASTDADSTGADSAGAGSAGAGSAGAAASGAGSKSARGEGGSTGGGGSDDGGKAASPAKSADQDEDDGEDDADEDDEDADDDGEGDDDEDSDDEDDEDDEEEDAEVAKEKEEAAKKQKEKLDALNAEYLAAVEAYEAALDRKAANTKSIARLEAKIAGAESLLDESRKRLEAASIEMYKNAIEPGDLVDALFSANSLGESFMLFDDYEHLQSAMAKQLEDARSAHVKLQGRLWSLQSRRDVLVGEVDKARELVEEAKDALRRAAHLDGAKYHQVQKNGVNCGATAFTVAVNIMLGKERYKDNLAVWSSKAFGGDSTVNLAEKGQAWLADKKLDDKLAFSYVKGDIFKAEDMRALLEAGNMVVISSGSGSEWQRVDKADSQKGLYPGGHWIVFYGYSEGIFYANDSAVSAKKGAGCPYTTKQMQQWLDGRSYHFACTLSRVPQEASS